MDVPEGDVSTFAGAAEREACLPPPAASGNAEEAAGAGGSSPEVAPMGSSLAATRLLRRLVVASQALRLSHWVKNLAVFLPAAAAHALDAQAWRASASAFVAFGLVASGNYLVNDLLDLEADRRHPRKRHRPLASGALSVRAAQLLATLTLAVGLVVGGGTSSGLVLVLLGYLALAQAYSLWLKTMFILDIFVLTGFHMIRVLAGSVVTGIYPSNWMLAFLVFLFLALAALKRTSELALCTRTHGDAPTGRGYELDDRFVTTVVVLVAGYAAVLVFALYVDTETARQLYAHPDLLWLLCPVMLLWITRAAALGARGAIPDDPILFAVRDRASIVLGGIGLLLVVAAACPVC